MTKCHISGSDAPVSSPAIQWSPYKGKELVPLDEPLLFELDSNRHRYQVGTFWQNGAGQTLGRIGDRFEFDCKPIRYIPLNELLQFVKEAPDET